MTSDTLWFTVVDTSGPPRHDLYAKLGQWRAQAFERLCCQLADL